MIKYLIFIILSIFIIIYFFISTNKVNNNSYKKAPNVDNKKVDLIDNFINTKAPLEKNYHQKPNYDKPKTVKQNLNKNKQDTNLDMDVDVNKETRELNKVQFKLDKKF